MFADDWPYSVIEAIDPIDVLSAPQRELLGELVIENAELGGDVAIYWLRNNPRRPPQAVVAPVSDDLKTGDQVVGKGWSAVQQNMSLDVATGDPSLVELHACGRLVRADSGR
jgi:hypothetical protein